MPGSHQRNSVISITPRQDQVNRALRELAHIRGGAPKALAAALNKTATGAKTDTVRILAKLYTAKQKHVREAVFVGPKASAANLRTSIIGRRDIGIPLIFYRHKRKRIIDKRGRRNWAVYAEVKQGETNKLQWAFMATIKGERHIAAKIHRGERVPIRRLYGPSVPSMMNNDEVANTVLSLAQARLDKYLAHEIDRIEKGYGK